MNKFGFLKRGAKKFLSEARPTPETLEAYKRLQNQWLSERTFYFGGRRLRAQCLEMESAPGTVETVISEFLRIKPQGWVLDFGCGQHKSGYLKALGFNVHSCDIFDFDFPNYTKIDPKISKLPFKDGEFEIAVVSEVIEHVESPFELLKEIARVTEKIMLVTTPNPMSLKSRKQFFKTGYLHWFAPENFEYHISPVFNWQVELFCRRHGWRLDKLLANHHAFSLNDAGKVLEYAEALIYRVGVINEA